MDGSPSLKYPWRTPLALRVRSRRLARRIGRLRRLPLVLAVLACISFGAAVVLLISAHREKAGSRISGRNFDVKAPRIVAFRQQDSIPLQYPPGVQQAFDLYRIDDINNGTAWPGAPSDQVDPRGGQYRPHFIFNGAKLQGEDFWKGSRRLAASEQDELKWNYLVREKYVPITGHPYWMSQMPVDSRGLMNSLCVVDGADLQHHHHGRLGVLPDRPPPGLLQRLKRTAEGIDESSEGHHDVWQPASVMPPADPEKYEFGGMEGAMKKGGFYLDLSNALPLERLTPDARPAACRESFNITELAEFNDATVVITFFNEPLSTLLRTVHSVLNYTPAPLLREIILVDDHSDLVENLPGGPLHEYVKVLPKVKLMRLHERLGIVKSRLAGAASAKGNTLVVLDSHVELNAGWLEPLLQRINESPKSIVFPQILSIDPITFDYLPKNGIGCRLDFRWTVVEHAQVPQPAQNTQPMTSPSMAGGLFAVNKQWFWDLGGYDQGFVAWGAENVEMALRAWMCGGRVECMPCSLTYHIYRKGGAGYSNPLGALWRNRHRTARLWFGKHYQIAERCINAASNRQSGPGIDPVGDLEEMLRLKERLQCHDFDWYLREIDKGHDLAHLDDLLVLGRMGRNGTCLDSMGKRAPGSVLGSYPCHPHKRYSGSQGFLLSKGDWQLRWMGLDKRCIRMDGKGRVTMEGCVLNPKASQQWKFEWVSDLPSEPGPFQGKAKVSFPRNKHTCLALVPGEPDKGKVLKYVDCDADEAIWDVDGFVSDPNYPEPTIRPRHLRRGVHG